MSKKISELEFKKRLLALSAELAEYIESIYQKPEVAVDLSPLVKEISNFHVSMGSSLYLLNLLQTCADIDDFIFVHSVKVALLCQVMGRLSNFSAKQIDELTLSALLHDIGKMVLSEDVIYKKTPLNKEEISGVMSHASAGYDILVQTNQPHFVALCAKHHHERWNGSGYPSNLKGEEIPLYARYVAIADVVDALTSNRPYRDAICPFNVAEILDQNGYVNFDPNAYIPFLAKLSQAFVGVDVELSNGKVGKVILLGKKMSQPVVQVGDRFIDLGKFTGLTIVKLKLGRQ